MFLRDALPLPLLTLLSASCLLLPLTNAAGQAGLNQEYQIQEITPAVIQSPQFNIGGGPSKRTKPKEWLEVEVEFSWEPREQPEIPYTDELTLTYYILLNNISQEYPQGALLVGSVDHVYVPMGKEKRSVMYVSPRTLERYFGGKVPTTLNQMIQAVGVSMSVRGQVVAQNATKGENPWWQNMQQIPNSVLNKNDTPFKPLFWDYYEPIKSDNR